jgi:K(+)-stimulated pyrophosphate-energized sodium pump
VRAASQGSGYGHATSVIALLECCVGHRWRIASWSIIVFQVALISALSAAVVVAALAWSLRERRGLLVPQSARRVLIALERASSAAIRRRATRLPLLLGGALCVMVAARYLLNRSGHTLPVAFEVLSALVALTLGMLSSLVVAFLCGHHASKHSFFATASASISVNRYFSVAVSSAAMLTIATEAAGMIAGVSVHGLLWMLARGALDGTTPGADPASIAARLSPCFGIGATLAALVLGQTGIAYVGATTLTGTSAFEIRTQLSPLDPRNPAVLLEGLGRQLGGVVPRSLDAYVSGTLLAAISLQIAAMSPTLGGLTGASTVAMIPLLVRAFGLLASLFGMIAIRASEHEDLRKPFTRGQLVAHIVLASALAGITVWSVGAITVPVAFAAIIGLVLASALGHLRALLLARARMRRSNQSTVDGARAGQNILGILEATASGLSSMFWPILAYTLALGSSEIWFEHASVPDLQKIVAILIGLTAPSALTSFHHMVAVCRDFESLGTLAASVGRVSLSNETAQRLRKITEVSERVGISTAPVLSDSTALLCGLVALVCQASHAHAPPTVPPPTLVLLGVSVLVLVPGLLAIMESMRSGARAARTQNNESDRQLRGMRRDGPIIQVPTDFVPSYRSCIELLARDSAHGGLASASAALVLPVLSMALFTRGPENTAGSPALGLASYAAIAAAAGLAAMQIGHAASFAFYLANRGNASARPATTSPIVSVSEPLRLLEFLGHSLGVVMPLLTRVVALSALAFSAFLT